jgi:predicted transposase YbfD/YdcC
MAREFMESPFAGRSLVAKSRCLSPMGIRQFFAKLPDPRRRVSRVRYRLLSLIVIAICATIAGANDSEEIALFARTHRAWLARLIELPDDPKQVPSHDTFDRVLSALDPIAFQKCLLAWLQALHEHTQGLIAIDGKAAREAMARAGDQGPLTLVSAWASTDHLFLGQVTGVPGSNELEAIPRLLELLELQGAIVTLDALGCQQHIVEQIVENKGDYVVAVKGNQPTLEAAVHKAIDDAVSQEPMTAPTLWKEESRRRRETRCYVAVPVPPEAPEFDAWLGARSLVSVTRECTDAKGQSQIGTRYYLSSLPPKVKLLAQAVRGHWKVENELHWVLDVTFREDHNRSRAGHAQANLGVLRRVALSMLKNAPDLKGSMNHRRKQAGWDEATLEKALFGKQVSES